MYLTNEYASGLESYKLLPTQSDRSSYCALIDGNGADQRSSLVSRAYNYFRDQLTQSDPDGNPLDLKKLEQVLMSRVELVSITLGEHDNEYRIFESLNAKGTPLTQADLLRNYLFMRMPVSEQENLYHRVWLPFQTSLGDQLDDFFRYELMSKGRFVREGDVYQEWKRDLDRLTPDGIVEHLSVFAQDGAFYLRLISPQHEPNPSLSVGLQRLNRWGGQTMYPFLLNVYRWFDQGEVDAIGCVDIVRMVESFLVRRLFARVPTNALNRLFVRLAHQLPEGPNKVDGTLNALSDPGRRWPSDDEFRGAILRYPLYSDSRPDQRKMILETLEADVLHKEKPTYVGTSIEHIMPQTLTPAWKEALGSTAPEDHRRLLHVLGNLTLSAYNSELSNDPFEKKRKRFSSSNFELNKRIALEESWTSAKIEKRGKGLAERALRIWPGPVENELSE